MEGTSEKVPDSDLQEDFNDLKKLSLMYKLSPSSNTSGDEVSNPLHKQFSKMLSKIEESLKKETVGSDDHLRTVCMKSSIIYEKAKLLLSLNLLEEGKEHLEESLNALKDHAENPKVHFLYLRIMNHWTYVTSRIGNLESAKDALIKIIRDETKCKPEVFSTEDLFFNTKKDENLSKLKLYRLSVNNLQMLAWIYAKLGNTDDHLKIQHDILQKQLEFGEDVLKWTESCYKLAVMFIGNGDWENARYHLSAAETVLKPLEITFAPNPEVHAIQADIGRTWVYYGLQLFQTSKKINEDENTNRVVDGTNSTDSTESKAIHKFEGLVVDVPESIPISKINSLNDAKALFGGIYKWIKRARLYYTLRDYPLQYVNLTLDLSELYRYWCWYEMDINSQYMVQKKRYDALEGLVAVLKDVRPNCYAAVVIEVTKEIVEVQMEMMTLNLKKIYTPPEVASEIANEDVLKRQLNAFSSIHYKLESVSSYVDSNNQYEPNTVRQETGSDNESAKNDING